MLEVSRAEYYAWKTRPKSNRDREDAEITALIKKIHEEHHGRLGIDRITVELAKLPLGHRLAAPGDSRAGLTEECGSVGRWRG